MQSHWPSQGPQCSLMHSYFKEWFKVNALFFIMKFSITFMRPFKTPIQTMATVHAILNMLSSYHIYWCPATQGISAADYMVLVWFVLSIPGKCRPSALKLLPVHRCFIGQICLKQFLGINIMSATRTWWWCRTWFCWQKTYLLNTKSPWLSRTMSNIQISNVQS